VYGCHSPGHVFTDRRAAATDAGLRAALERIVIILNEGRGMEDALEEVHAVARAALSRQAEKETA
jgi:hypothetical protein